MPDPMDMNGEMGGMGGPPPGMPGQPPPPGAQSAGQLAQKPGGSTGSLLQMILTFLAGAGLKETMTSLQKIVGKSHKAMDPNAKSPGGGGAPPPGQPPQGGLPPGMTPQMLQQIMALLMSKGGQGPQPPPQ